MNTNTSGYSSSATNTSGIYKLSINGKFYIGQSENTLHRFHCHLAHLRSNRHCNPKLQDAYNSYGEAALNFSLIKACPVKDLNTQESIILQDVATDPNCLNIRTVGNVSRSADTRAKMSKAKKTPVVCSKDSSSITFNSKEEAATFLNRTPGRISQVLDTEARCNGWHVRSQG